MAYVSGQAAREEFRARLFALDLLDREAAQALGVHDRTLYKWLAGERRIPISAVRLLDMMILQKRHAAMQQSAPVAPQQEPVVQRTIGKAGGEGGRGKEGDYRGRMGEGG
jgi:hypothetical protein